MDSSTVSAVASQRRPRDVASNNEENYGSFTSKMLKTELHPIATPGPGTLAAGDAVNPLTRQPCSPRYYRLLESRLKLPVSAEKQKIIEIVKAHPVTIIVGETGSGKTTQIPPFLACSGAFLGQIVCTQPRRIAALSVAHRVAQEMDCQLGKEVGFHVRFQAMHDSSVTRVLYMTDGILLKECISDRNLGRVSVVVVDEVHERTASTDVLLGLLKPLLLRRQDFRVVVMSATLDVAKLKGFFPNAPLLTVPGRTFPVSVHYLSTSSPSYIEAAIGQIVRIHQEEPEGDILCFLTGEREIFSAMQGLKASLLSLGWKSDGGGRLVVDGVDMGTSRRLDCMILPLYGALALSDQEKVFTPAQPGTRKIIFSTNIAETSITVEGVVYVVDCGYQKQNLYNPEARVEYLMPAVISKASAEQRRGRAGRTQPGKCFRLMTEEDYKAFPAQSYPEMLCTGIVDIVLLLLELGVQNPLAFDFLDPPSEESLQDAFCQLLLFKAVDETLKITPLGKKMASFPVKASASRMLIKAAEYGCASDVAVIVAMQEGGRIYTGRGGGPNPMIPCASPVGDHITAFFTFHEVRQSKSRETFCANNNIRLQSMHVAFNVYDQLRSIMERNGVVFTSTYNSKENMLDTVAVRKALLEGFFLQVAFLVDPEKQLYRTVCESVDARIHRDSILQHRTTKFPQWVIYDRLEVQGENELQRYGGTQAKSSTAVASKREVVMRGVSEINPEWLLTASEFYSEDGNIEDREIAYAIYQLKLQQNSSIGKEK